MSPRRENRKMLENPSDPAASAGTGPFLMAGYCIMGQQSFIELGKCIADAMKAVQHTEVVLTPQSSNFSKVGVGALGVSMKSNSLSELLAL
jgi:hypothetical protein